MPSTLVRVVAASPVIDGESDRRVRIRFPVDRRQGLSSLTSTPQSAAYVVAAGYTMNDYELVADGEIVGVGRDVIVAWVEANLPGLLDHARSVVAQGRSSSGE